MTGVSRADAISTDIDLIFPIARFREKPSLPFLLVRRFYAFCATTTATTD
jgi:hypothetical protein